MKTINQSINEKQVSAQNMLSQASLVIQKSMKYEK